MNRPLIIRLLIIFITSWLLLSALPSAYVYDDEATIELNVTQAQPSASITIRGGGFAPGDTTTIELMLVRSDQPQVLGTTTADLTGGAYEVREADTHHVATAHLNIVTDSGDDDESGQRGEDEPLLAPIPTQVVSTGYSTAAPTASITTPLATTEVEPPIPIS